MPKLIFPFLEEVVHLVADFLETLEYTKEANKIRKDHKLPGWVLKNNVLFNKGLKKVLRDYINSDQKTLKYFKQRGPDSEQSQQESQQPVIVTKKNSKKSPKPLSPKKSPINNAKSPKVKASTQKQENAWVTSRFSQPMRLQDINQEADKVQIKEQIVKPQIKQKKTKRVKLPSSSQEESSEQPKPKKKIKKQKKKQKKQKKVKGPVDTSYLNSDDDFELEAKPMSKQKKKKAESIEKQQIKKPLNLPTRKQSVQIQKMEQQAKVHNSYNINSTQNSGKDGYKKFFSRINADQIGFIPENLRDNSFEAKSRYGAAAGDEWGRFGHQKLKSTRGQSFKKTKGKLKNKAFQGSGININQINSVLL